MKINHEYVQEAARIIFETISGCFAFFGFIVLMLLLTFANRDSLIAITSDPEIKTFVEERMKRQDDPNKKGKSQLILNFTGG